MDRVYQDAKDKNVAKVIVYVSSAKAYSDAAHKTQMKTSELKDAFMKGCVLVSTDGTWVAPTSYTEASKVGTIVGLDAGATGTTTTTVRAASVAD